MAMVTIRQETPFDVAAREALLDQAFGECRLAKTAQRLRDGRLPAEALSFVAVENRRVIGTVRLWDVTAGPKQSALLLGPIAVACDRQGGGIGSALMHHCLRAAGKRGHEAVLLVGDAPYYSRFGFSADATGALWLPGPYERNRLLAREFVPGALADARGLVSATGRLEPKPELSALVAGLARHDISLASHAA
jgi:predicted N-acetyltransferase YhbS